MKAAIYARISTKNTHQDLETQLIALRSWVERRGLQLGPEYTDAGISGSVSSRPGLDTLMKDAHLRLFDSVVVARFDRFARSTKHLITALETFQALGIEFVSLNESIDTSTPMGKAMFTIIGAMAELERNIIRERVLAGLDRAKKQGKVLGPPRKIFDRERVRELRAEGQSLRQIAQGAGVSKDTVRKALLPKDRLAHALEYCEKLSTEFRTGKR